jgi:exopolyphosphatase/guanosine-5'-triphosphate,3'-diphosphate pyrophosphatase
MSATSNRIAVIDIGTNTINLLVAEMPNGVVQTHHFSRIPARLGAGGMQEGVLTDAAMQRGLKAILQHQSDCRAEEVSRIKVTATSAVRTASNATVFTDLIKHETGLDIEVIGGEREAELIWKGVRLTGLLDDGPGLIMDIGGGSTEFILADAERVFWMKSYRLGVTRLMERFKAPDPFTLASELAMKEEISRELLELKAAFEDCKVKRLIGASGSFNSIDLMLFGGDESAVPLIKNRLPLADYHTLSAQLRNMPSAGRASIPGLIADRVDTIPYSALLIDLILEQYDLDEVWRSSYALKEGVLSELI